MRIGRVISRAVIASAAVLALSGAAANAGVLYQNPDPISSSPGNVDAWTLNFGFIVADTFTLSSSSNLSSIDFVSWNFPGDHISSIDWSITSGANSGTLFASGTGSVTDSLLSVDNGFGYNLELNTFNLNVDLAAGTYWLNLQNAVVSNGDPAYWDQGGGASQAWESADGFLTADNACGGTDQITNGSCAETFRINSGTRIPEPITLSLFGAGLIGAAAARRRKAKSA